MGDRMPRRYLGSSESESVQTDTRTQAQSERSEAGLNAILRARSGPLGRCQMCRSACWSDPRWRRREPADLRSTFCSGIVSLAKRLNRRSERVRGRVASTVRWPRSERSVLAGSTSAPAHRSGGAHSSKRRAREQRCRRLRATPLDSVGEPSGAAPYSGGSPGLFSGGVYGTPPRGHPWLPGAFPQGVPLAQCARGGHTAALVRTAREWTPSLAFHRSVSRDKPF